VTATVPDRLPELTVTVAVPFWIAVSNPATTVTTDGLSEVQVTVPLTG